MTFERAPRTPKATASNATPYHHSNVRAGEAAAGEPGGEHDFDFSFGRWKTHIRRLKDPLSGSTNWVEYDGTHAIRRVWNGRANVGELEADGPEGHIEAVSPRLYNPQTQLWSVRYGDPRDGSLSKPLVGRFKSGRGEFYGEEVVKGRAGKPQRKSGTGGDMHAEYDWDTETTSIQEIKLGGQVTVEMHSRQSP